MNSMQANEQRSVTTGPEDGGARLRRLVRQPSRRDTMLLPMTLLLLGAASVAHELSDQDPKHEGAAKDGAHPKAPANAEAQPGDKIAVMAGATKVAEHVLTEDDVAAGRVSIAVRANGKAEAQETAQDAAATEADAANYVKGEPKAEAATASGDDAGAIVAADAGGAGGAAATPAAQQGDDDHSGAFWLFLGLGAVGGGIAIANHGGDNHAAPPTEEPPPPPPTQISGEVIKGYLQGAAVYLDADHDGQPDGEPVYTDSQGRFTFTSDETGASLLAYGGVDTLTNVPLDGLILRAPAGATVISPLTTLIDEMMKQDDSLSADRAQARLATVLGLTLSSGVDLLTFDPIENLQNGGSGIEDQSESVLNTISAIQSLLVGSGAADAEGAANAAITAMAQSILEGEGSLDLTSAADVAQVLEAAFSGTGVGASDAADLTKLATAIAAVNSSLLEASGLSDAALQATRYALTGFQDLLTTVGAGAHSTEQYGRDISFSENSELASAVDLLATGSVADVIDEHIATSISYAQRLEGERFVFALNPELKLYQGAPDKIDTVTVKFDASGVVIEREVRGANGEVSIEVISPAADGTYTLQYSELDKISIRPPADFNGALGADIFVHYVGLGMVDSGALDIAIISVNDAPTGQDSTVTTSEDLAHVFTAADFPFTDAIDDAQASGGDALGAVKIVSLPQAGTLYLGDTAISAQDVADGFYVSASDIAAGLFRFVPDADTNGESYASFQFQVRDDGGTANGGLDLDVTEHTLTVNVASANDAPTTDDATVTLDEDQTHTFSPQDFAFTDLEHDSLGALIITSLPEGGSLWHDDHQITLDDLGAAGYSISGADLAGGLFRFVPDADTNGDLSFDFRVQDNGGTDNNGADMSALATFTVNVTAVNDAPMLDLPASYSVGDGPVLLAPEASLHDIELDALNGGEGNWSGATITLQRQGGANGNDVFGHQMPEGLLPLELAWQESGTITKNGAVIATYSNSSGQLQLHFTGFGSNIPTTADVNELLRQITYSNAHAESEVVIEYHVADGNASFHGLQGSGGEGVVTGAVTVNIVPALGTPTVSLETSSDSGQIGDGITNDNQPFFRVDLPEVGAFAGSVVELFVEGLLTPVATHTLTADDFTQGWVALQPEIVAPDGGFAVTARLSDSAGEDHSEFSAPFFAAADTELPGVAVLDFSSLTVREDDAASFVVSGTAESFETVHLQLSISDEAPLEYTVTADRDGRFNVPVELSSFGHATVNISAWVTDAAGNSSQASAATLTITDALPEATVITGTADDEVISEVAGDAVQFQPGADGGTDHFIGSTTAFDSVLLTGSMADYAVTLVTGETRSAEEILLNGQGAALIADEPLYRVLNWTDGANTELWVQADSLIFDDGSIRLTGDGMVASSADTILHGDIGFSNRLTGGAGDDTLFGHDGQDWLNGGSGDDTLLTTAGLDTLIGGEGDDKLIVAGDIASSGDAHLVTLFGGSGSDVFMVAPQAGFDRPVEVVDFLIGEDKIDLSWLRVNDGGSVRELTVADLHLDQLNAVLQEGGSVDIGLSQLVTVDNSPIDGILTVQLVGGASTLTEGDFILAASSSAMPDDTLLSQAYLMGAA